MAKYVVFTFWSHKPLEFSHRDSAEYLADLMETEVYDESGNCVYEGKLPRVLYEGKVA